MEHVRHEGLYLEGINMKNYERLSKKWTSIIISNNQPLFKGSEHNMAVEISVTSH